MNKELVPSELYFELRDLGIEPYRFVHKAELEQGIFYSQAFRWFRNQYITKMSINERGDYIEGNFFMLPLIFPNGYEIKLLKPSTSYTIVGGREIPFYAEPEAVYKETTESYESAELACLKKLIEILKNK